MQELDRIAQKLGLSHLDNHQSLSFLLRNHGIPPSRIAIAAIILFLFVILLLDGSRFLASLFTFLLPLLYCFDMMLRQNKAAVLEEEQRGKLTDEQYSKVVSGQRREKGQTVETFIIYFCLYALMEVATPIMEWLTGRISWLILRVLLTLLLLHPSGLVGKLRKIIRSAILQENVPRRRNVFLQKKLN